MSLFSLGYSIAIYLGYIAYLTKDILTDGVNLLGAVLTLTVLPFVTILAGQEVLKAAETGMDPAGKENPKRELATGLACGSIISIAWLAVFFTSLPVYSLIVPVVCAWLLPGYAFKFVARPDRPLKKERDQN